MAITYQCEDGIEPVSDSFGEQMGNMANYAVLAGCAPTYSAAALTVDLAAGSIIHNGSMITVPVAAAGWTLVADPTNPRWTWLAISSTGTPVVVSGDPLAVPTVPELGDRVAVALVKVEAAQTIANNIAYKLDKRVFRPIFAGNGTATTITSAAALPVVNQFHHVSASNTITSLPYFAAGIVVVLTFDAACPITHNATSLILIGGASVTTGVGDTLTFISEGSGNWRQIGKPPSGSALTISASDAEVSTAGTTSVTLKTISGLSIAAGTRFTITGTYRKSAGSATASNFGLIVNATTVLSDAANPVAQCSGTNQAEDGYFRVEGYAADATHTGALLIQYQTRVTASGSAVAQLYAGTTTGFTAAMPAATITSIAITCNNGNASQTSYLSNLRVTIYPSA